MSRSTTSHADSRRDTRPVTTRSASVRSVDIAGSGVSGGGGTLPHAERIQQSFGHHDISAIRAHTGAAAQEANRAMGSVGYATGHQLAFAGTPSLMTAAHEAAHVIQQRAGLSAGHGPVGASAAYERHADAVAERVVQGKSAEDLLDQFSQSSHERPGRIQMRSTTPQATRTAAVQLRRHSGQNSHESMEILNRVLAGDNVSAMRGLVRALAEAPLDAPTTSGPRRITCVAGGDTFELTFAPDEANEMRRRLDHRIQQLESSVAHPGSNSAVHSSSEGQPTASTAEGHLASRFNARFAPVIGNLRNAGGGGNRGEGPYTGDELRLMFSPTQRSKLQQFCDTTVIPDHLFGAGDAGNLSNEQRIVVSGHILSTGRYTPGSHSQRLHAWHCGHFARLVRIYAGLAEQGRVGAEHNFDHNGNVALGAGGTETEHSGAVRPATETERSETRVAAGQRLQRSITRGSLPFEEFDTVRPGDWLYTNNAINRLNTPDGDHSVVFAGWRSGDREHNGIRFRQADVFEQQSPESGGRRSSPLLGESAGQVNGATIQVIVRVTRANQRAEPAATPGELARGDLGLRDRASPRINATNEAFLRTHARGRRLDEAALREFLRRANRDLIGRLGARLDEQQRALLEATNQESNLEVLVRLNERLNHLTSTSDAITAGTERTEARLEAERSSRAQRVDSELVTLRARLATLHNEAAALVPVAEIDERRRGLFRERTQKSRALQRARVAVRTARPEERPALLERVTGIERELAAIDAQLDRLATERAAMVEGSAITSTSVRAGRGRASLERLQQNRREQAAAEQRMAVVEDSVGYVPAVPVGRDTFAGRTRTPTGAVEQQRPPTGHFANIRPQPDWNAVTVAHEAPAGGAPPRAGGGR